MKLAFYLRLSQADGDLDDDNKDESNSIENQRALLQAFVGSHEDMPKEAVEYIDDGYSGTNFNRPGFTRMLEDAKKGEFDTLLVKDLSRLGRDYIGVGDYMEQVFPMLGIRFIAVNSNYDSDDYIGKTMGLDMSITNLVNALYSRDLSKKFTSSLHTKWNRGISTAGRVPFGYTKDPENKGKWLLDPESAKYVRMVFDKALENWSTSMIANYMNEQHIPTPGQYREQHKRGACGRKVTDEEWVWDTRMVWMILKNYAYTGALVHGKTKSVSVGSKSRRNVKEKDWYVVEGTHEAIVTKEEFENAQIAIQRMDMPSMRQDAGFSLKGKICCGNCKLRMHYHYGATPVIYCGHAMISGKASNCCHTRYDEKWVEGIVLYSLNQQFELLSSLVEKLEKKKGQAPDDLEAQKKKIEKKIQVLQEGRIRLYERYAEGMITLEQYQTEKTATAEQVAKLQEQLDKANSFGKKEDSLIGELDSFRYRTNEITPFDHMTREIAESFIDTVYIYNKNKVEIIFAFDDVIQRATEYLEQEESDVTAKKMVAG